MNSAATNWAVVSGGAGSDRAPPALTDAELFARLRSGDRSAEEMLYRRHAGRLARTVARLLGSEAEAQDIVHDTFLIAGTTYSRLRDPERFGAWLLQIAVRLAYAKIRRVRLLRRLGFVAAGDEATLESLADPATSPETRAELALLDAQLAPLPARERIPWMLRYVDGYRLEEVAAACGVSLATAKRRIAAVNQVVRMHVRLEETGDE